jgi:ribosome-associated protein
MQTSTIINLINDHKGLDIINIEVSHLTQIADNMIICTATSTQHAKSIANKLQKAYKENGVKNLIIEGYDEANWILIDGDMTITHIFLQSTREHYDIEKLWSISEQKLLEISQAAENNGND